MAKKKQSSSPELKTLLEVPIYDALVWLVVSPDAAQERSNMNHIFGAAPGDWDACCARSGGREFGLFFLPSALNINTIGHEVFHLTHRILEWASCNFDAAHHEQGALLHGYLLNQVFTATHMFR